MSPTRVSLTPAGTLIPVSPTQADANTQETPEEQRVTQALVLILSGQSGLSGPALLAATVGAIALLLPAFIAGALRDAVSIDIARMVLRDYPKDTGGSGALLVASRENIAYRALYGVSAAKRAVAALIGPAESEPFERLAKWEQAERSYFEAHQNASVRREKSETLKDAMVDAHGPVLSWIDTGHAATHRPEHLRASGKNVDTRNGKPKETGAWPGEKPGCDCVFGPPKSGAALLK